MKGKFWTKTVYCTHSLEEAVSWIDILTNEYIIYEMSSFKPNKNTTVYAFIVNANTYVCERLVEEFGFPKGSPFVA